MFLFLYNIYSKKIIYTRGVTHMKKNERVRELLHQVDLRADEWHKEGTTARLKQRIPLRELALEDHLYLLQTYHPTETLQSLPSKLSVMQCMDVYTTDNTPQIRHTGFEVYTSEGELLTTRPSNSDCEASYVWGSYLVDVLFNESSNEEDDLYEDELYKEDLYEEV